MAVVYRFHTWDSHNDVLNVSNRWATKEAIEYVGGQAVSQGVELDDAYIGAEIPGMTAVGFDAQNPPTGGFQTRVR